MKIRNGFVSNSSTSSFIIYGWKIEQDNENYKKIENNEEYLYDEESSGSVLYVGNILADTDEPYNMENCELSIEELKNEKYNGIKEKYDLKDEDAKLIFGNRIS